MVVNMPYMLKSKQSHTLICGTPILKYVGVFR